MTDAPGADPHTEPVLSVIVLCRNDAGTLGRVLRGLAGQRPPGVPAEIVLVDSSDDGAGARVAEGWPGPFPLEVVGSPVGLTPGAARNRGIERTRGRHVAFLAADCIPAPDWMARRMAWHRQGRVAVAGAVACAAPRTIAARVQWLTRFAGALPGGRPREGTLPLSGWSYERSLLDPPFREDLPLGEDSELNARLVADGVRPWFDPAIQIAHVGLPGFSRVRAHQFRHGAAAARLQADPRPWWPGAGEPGRSMLAWYPVAKWARAAVRVGRWSPRILGPYLMLTPWILVAHAAWAEGFLAERRRLPTGPPGTP